MLNRIRIIAVVVLLSGAIATTALAFRVWQSSQNGIRSLYTQSVKKRDIVDAARNAIEALNDAELRVQNYVLTGETVYSEAWKDDVQTWENESGTLAVIAQKDDATVAAKDFVQAGKRTTDELAAIVADYEKSGRDPALARIRKSTAIVSLDEARKHLAEVLQMEAGAIAGTPILNRSLSSARRLMQSVAALFAATLVASVLLFLGAWRVRRN